MLKFLERLDLGGFRKEIRMDDLDQKIREMRHEGVSLRKIAQAVGLTHEGVRKRLRSHESKGLMSTAKKQEIPVSSNENEMVSTLSSTHKSWVSEEISDTDNRVSTSKPPPPFLKVSTLWKCP